ncbi:MAG: polysaccharide biosynthesis/export family protein [Moraxellaceae bacterium]|nr:polysaccharide biosynthesis/export family protein [Moraxellaceae bacterium]
MQSALRWLLVVVCFGLSSSVQAGIWERLFGGGAEVRPQSDQPVLVLPSQSSVVAPFSVASDYKLGPGDRLGVTVFNEKELSLEVRLSDAGTLSFPLLGEIRAQGMTIGMLQDNLTEQLKAGFLVNPQVYVTIIEYRQFFVNGEVNKPGGFPYQPGLTVRKAISLAGGLTPRASFSKIFIIHEDDPFGRPRQAALDTQLRPGDILTIEQSFF